MVDLSAEAKKLLKAASQDKEHLFLKFEPGNLGHKITIKIPSTGEIIIDTTNIKETKSWKAAVQNLLDEELAEPAGGTEYFKITESGLKLAETLRENS